MSEEISTAMGHPSADLQHLTEELGNLKMKYRAVLVDTPHPTERVQQRFSNDLASLKHWAKEVIDTFGGKVEIYRTEEKHEATVK